MNESFLRPVPSSSNPRNGGNAKALRAGSIVTVRVLAELGGGRFSVSTQGVRMTVTSDLPLKPGSLLRARVGTVDSSAVLTVVQEPVDASVQPAMAGMGDPARLRLATEALQRLGLPLTRDNVAAVASELTRSRKPGPRLARLVALLLDKRVTLDPRTVDEVARLVDGPFPRDHEPSEGGSGKREGERGSSPLPGERTPDLEQESLAEAVATASRSGEDNLLLLLNHLKANHHQWIVVPFRSRSKDKQIEGTLRVLFDERKRATRCAIVVGEPGSPNGLAFELRGWQQRTMTLHVGPGARAAIQREVGKLAENLRILGVEIDDTMKDFGLFDGFSSEEVATGPVNTLG